MEGSLSAYTTFIGMCLFHDAFPADAVILAADS